MKKFRAEVVVSLREKESSRTIGSKELIWKLAF